MAQPPGNETRSYSPSKLTDLPAEYLTPSTGPLNNSGAYAQADLGPIIASGHGQPRRREGQAYWDDTAPMITTIPSSPPPVAGRSPLDSAMNSPESEEPTLPVIPTTQVDPATLMAIDDALGLANDNSQTLWDNVPSMPADLPPQPEVIEVRGRSPPTSHTPRARSRAPSNASVWSHATVESTASDEAQPFTLPALLPLTNETFHWHTLAAAIRAGLLPDPFDPNQIDMSSFIPDGDEDETIAELQTTLNEEVGRDVSSLIQAWGTYRLLHPLELRRNHQIPATNSEFHMMTTLLLTTLDAGAANHDGELMVRALTPASWMRLTMATLGAILRGAMRSPSELRKGSRSLNGIDSFPIHPQLDHPLTEGGAIMLMCQQLGGLFTSNRNHPDKSYPDSYFDKMITLIDANMYKVPTATSAQPNPPLTEGDRAQARAGARETLILSEIEVIRLDPDRMGEIKEAVKAEIFASLNAEALQNADEWRALYKHEFVQAMHDAFEAQYPGVHPGKGKAREAPPVTNSQVVRDAEPRIKQEVAIQVEARVKNIHQEIQDSIAEGDPFWTGGPAREAIARDIHKATTAQIEQEMIPVVAELKQQAEDELHLQKQQLSHQCSTRLSEFKDNMWHAAKDWRTKYRNARSINILREEAHRRGYALTPIDPDALQKEADAFIKYALNPLEINGYELSSLPPSRIPSPDPEANPSTPPHPSSPLFFADPNVTPTPVRTKRSRIEPSPLPASSPPPPSSPYPYPQTARPNPQRDQWLANSSSQADVPLPPPTPMEEDMDYALEVWADHKANTNGGLKASLHACNATTGVSPTWTAKGRSRLSEYLECKSRDLITCPRRLTVT
ncbi:hypothetical protein EDB83DRAFT_2637966 [Lactarius deliciosus]|nr:hypothetical protein EDB83DRAFT_2637966 [Lactarius deliciosus]